MQKTAIMLWVVTVRIVPSAGGSGGAMTRSRTGVGVAMDPQRNRVGVRYDE